MSTSPEEIRIELKDGHIETYSAEGVEILWRVAVDRIQVMGEYTTSAGPDLEDYFLVFVCDRDTWYEVPMSATGIDRLLQSLSRHLESELSLNLVNSVELRSSVLWPSELKGEDLFRFEDFRPSGFLHSIAHLVGVRRVSFKLAEPLFDYLDDPPTASATG